MQGSFWVLLIALALFATCQLMHRFIEGRWMFARLPITWFYGSWLLGLFLLSMPLFQYSETFSPSNASYLIGVLLSFSFGTLSAAFWAQRGRSKAAAAIAAQQQALQTEMSTKALRTLLILGLIGTVLVMINAVLSGGLSLSERLDAGNLATLRSAAMTDGAVSHIGPLFGPANLVSAIGSLGVAYVFYLRGARRVSRTKSSGLRSLALVLMLLNFVVGLIGFGSRIFAIFAVLIAFLAFMEGRWSIGERLIVKRLTPKDFLVISLATITTLAALWVAGTVFLEKRVQRQDPQTLLYRTHRAKLDPLTYYLTRKDKTSQYFMLSLSYLTTPIPTLTFYLDLPSAQQPGPFFGEYSFPAIFRWGRRLAFSADPFFWERDRYDIFRKLGDIGFGMNVWSTLARDLVADFGKIGALVFLAVSGFVCQRVFDLQRSFPTLRRAGLLVYLRLLMLFAGLTSYLFWVQIYWPLYLAAFLVWTARRRMVKRRIAMPGDRWPRAMDRQASIVHPARTGIAER